MSSVGFTHWPCNSCWLTWPCCNELSKSLRKSFSKLRTQLRVFFFMNIYFTRFNKLINLIRQICDFNWRKQWHPHSSPLAWKIPWMAEPGGLQSMGLLRVGHDSYFPFTLHFHALEREMATHSSVPAWRIPAMGEPGGLPSMGSHRVGHWSDLAAAAAVTSKTAQNPDLPQMEQWLG